MIPDFPPVPVESRSNEEVAGDVSNLIELVKGTEAEICVIEGQSKIVQARRELTRIVVANPAIADVELLTDQPGARLLNLYGKTFGTTTLTIWDQTNRPVTFLVRVSLDTKDLESRIRQAFPGAEVKVRQVGLQIILDGQAPDSKTMSDIIQLVTFTLMSSPSFRGGAAGGGGGAAMMGGGGGGGGGMGIGGGVQGRPSILINRITIPGPRQVLLHVKIAEINRSATRSIGVSWLYARGNSILGSVAGNNATITSTSSPAYITDLQPSRVRESHPRNFRIHGFGLARPELPVVRRVRRRPFFIVHRRPSHQRSGKDPGRAEPRRASTGNPHGFWSAECFLSPYLRAHRYQAERPW